ncbi:MAG: hypothetical protein F6K50_47395 [Moorea sp. SIO3I7]|nr:MULTISPECIES: hypothetical protein [unclassified Moorena]NEO02693.1 hypothetical protein [Moorena sp. SIO3I7]NEO09535.1 hypothetical protein [Moorena sp. SIO3I8]NEO19673.1 hypothetical protein [Moorena sp. SIO4A5]NEP21789.1 hypothetical protein [Moorena sp. SIO3I6]NEQ59159.1 hypothetical protein [Moorena sp. SIO4A1]
MIKFDSVLMQPLHTRALHQDSGNCALLPNPYSLLPTPYSLLPRNLYLTN